MNHEKRIKDVTVRSILSSNVYKMIGFRMSSVNYSKIISFVVLTALLVGGFPNFMAQEAYAVANAVAFTNISNDDRMSGGATSTVVYTISGTDGVSAVAGQITFVRTGGTADATTHTYTMTAGGENDLSSSFAGIAHTKDVTELEADAGFADLVTGTI